MNSDKVIEVHKDKKLLELIDRSAKLSSEEVGFLPGDNINHMGRTIKDFAIDMINVYKETNEHLKQKYPQNEIAKYWIATNEFSQRVFEERWL